MLEEDWLEAVKAYAAVPRIHPLDPLTVAKEMLVSAYLLACQAPPDLLLRFSAVPDNIIDALVAGILPRLHMGDFAVRLAQFADGDSALTAMCGLIHALDVFISDTRTDHGVPSRPEQAWTVAASGGDAYLIPRSLSRKEKQSLGRQDLGAFVLRALKWHRILPCVLGGYRVRLHPSEVHLGRSDASLLFGGALFPDLDLGETAHSTAGRFRVDKVSCATLEDDVQAHVAQAHADECAILAFPELTIPPEQRHAIKTALIKRPWAEGDEGGSFTLPVVVAGSWHEEKDGHWFNVATVMDGWGKKVVEHSKLFPFVDHDGRLEDIKSGTELNVVVTEDAMIAIGVCRDFCERGGPAANPYSLLDVDVFLIASYGDEKTMAGHFATANDVQIRFRAQVFVVQQMTKNDKGLLGFVLSPDDKAILDLEQTKRTEPWKPVRSSKPAVDL